MEKLLHKRLREHSGGGLYLTKSTLDSVFLTKTEALRLADEIERYYIPRPRFEDGEPIQDSDLEEIGALATCCVFTDGSWVFEPDKYEDERNPKPWDKQDGRYCDRIKRPTPKVLDADGVEIKVGDKGWLNYKEHEMLEIKAIHPNGSAPGYNCDYVEYSDLTLGKARYFTHERPVFDVEGERICKGDTVWHVGDANRGTVVNINPRRDYLVKVVWVTGDEGFYKGDALTHRKPDSRSKVESELSDEIIGRIDELVKQGRWLNG